MISLLRGTLAVLLFLFCSFVGEAPARGQTLTKPADMDQVDIYLLTVGRGAKVYNAWGHTVLRIVDRQSGRDYNFNWGLFDFTESNFAWNFYKGRLIYRLGIWDYGPMIRLYRQEERKIVQEKFRLTSEQKRQLIDLAFRDAKPENRTYLYEQFYHNCSTIPRDHLDKVLGGAIADRYKEEPSGRTFRDHIKEYTAHLWWAYFGINFISNSYVDFPISEWEQMFLPAELRRNLKQMPAIGADGEPLPGTTLLGDAEVLLDFPPPRPIPNPFAFVGIFMSVVAFLMAAALWPRGGGETAAEGPLPRRGRRAVGAFSVFWGVVAGLLGTLLAANWILSDYTILKHNALLWLFWPVDFWFIAAGVLFWRRGSQGHGLPRRITRWMSVAHLMAGAVLVVLWLSGILEQDVASSLAVFLPQGLFYYGVAFRFGSTQPAAVGTGNV